MQSTLPAAIVIACPHCGTRYRVPPEAIGQGRKVSCAHCSKTWTAHQPRPPTPEERADALFEDEEEAQLDEAFRATAEQSPAKPATDRNEIPPEVLRTIAQIKAAIAPKTKAIEAKPAEPEVPSAAEAPASSPGDRAIAQGRFQRRQRMVARNLPTSRVRNVARIASLTALLATVTLGYVMRVDIVRAVPDLAGVYATLGLKVNVVGLDFSGLTTLVSRKNGGEVLTVDASIFSVETHPVPVPPVVIELFDAEGHSLYQWSVPPRMATLEPGESIAFSAELARPPAGAARATLSFAGSARRIEPAPEPAAATEAAAHHG